LSIELKEIQTRSGRISKQTQFLDPKPEVTRHVNKKFRLQKKKRGGGGINGVGWKLQGCSKNKVKCPQPQGQPTVGSTGSTAATLPHSGSGASMTPLPAFSVHDHKTTLVLLQQIADTQKAIVQGML